MPLHLEARVSHGEGKRASEARVSRGGAAQKNGDMRGAGSRDGGRECHLTRRSAPAKPRLTKGNVWAQCVGLESSLTHVSSRIVDSSTAQESLVFGPKPVMIALDQSGSLDIRYLRSIIFLLVHYNPIDP